MGVSAAVTPERRSAALLHPLSGEQKGVLRTAREQFRLGDAMRLRQLTDDLVLDLPATMRATMDGGGYPHFRYRYRTRPTEYLVLESRHNCPATTSPASSATWPRPCAGRMWCSI